jgi:hypothetical protein
MPPYYYQHLDILTALWLAGPRCCEGQLTPICLAWLGAVHTHLQDEANSLLEGITRYLFPVIESLFKVLRWTRSQWLPDLSKWMEFQRKDMTTANLLTVGVKPMPETSCILNNIPQIMDSFQFNADVMNRPLMQSYTPPGDRWICHSAEFGLAILYTCQARSKLAPAVAYSVTSDTVWSRRIEFLQILREENWLQGI